MTPRMSTALVAGLLLAGMSAPAGAQPETLAQIDCSASHRNGPILEVRCANADSQPGTVDLMYVCSTPLDFDRRIVFNEPGIPIGGGATLRLTRDCGPDQVVFTYQLWALTRGQLDDQAARQDQIRARRDRAAGR
ncbi:hypothetical protein ACFVUS_10940 [Nocardia sp. NPDC058058]|uniref:hypothetical protein n=1 Tax=Nocardia sp. NPDC058058 TaxID=3346317 RepID=UPI0036DC8B70